MPLLYILYLRGKAMRKWNEKKKKKLTIIIMCTRVCVGQNLLSNLDVWQFDVCNERETKDWRARIEVEKKEDIGIKNLLNPPAFCLRMLWKPANKVQFSCCKPRCHCWLTVITFLSFAICHTFYVCVCVCVLIHFFRSSIEP